MPVRHCISDDVAKYRELAQQTPDHEIQNKLRTTQFKKPPEELNRLWRAYCRIYRQEAHRRGLPT